MPVAGQSVRKPSRVYLRRGHPLTKNLSAAWPLQSGAGLAVHDVSGYQRRVTLSSGTETPSWVTGLFGPALSYDGSDDLATTDAWNGVTGSQNRTYSLWVKTNAANDDENFLAYGNHPGGTDGARFTFRIDALSGSHVIRVEVDGGFIKGSTDVADGDWHHVACALDGSNVTDINLYVDGAVEPIDSSSSQSINTDSDTSLHIGRRVGTPIGPSAFSGTMENLLAYDVALPSDAIQSLYERPFLPYITKPR